MEVHQLQMLRELGDLGSVKAVAETLMVTPSAVSQQLALLQKSVEVPLTRKEGRALVLTDAGRVLADAGAAVVSAMADARAAIGAYHDSPGSTVTVSAFHSAGQALFAPLAALLALDGGKSPRLRLADEDVAQEDFPGLAARYDLVLAHRMEHSPEWPRDKVAIIPLADEPLDVALPAGHPLAARRELKPADVVGQPWVTSRAGYSPADVLAAVVAVSGRPAEVLHRINDYSTVAALVATGGAIGLLPRFTARRVLDAGVVLRPLAGVNSVRKIDILARPETLKRASVMTVCDALRTVMTGLAGGTGR
ncbi:MULTISPECIES: LysR family transcriptional regulator [Arthrobacter]|uniref:LysR family transcriptional regulator n=1 Tax=Arthrobacter terricola TaxID=2547396 RepID=A0A4R5KZG6_9MICC|nr:MULTISPECIES: LysR family transcriptional regulator [Arthrobacter]MBT8160050.1 LysR family transcriptional regulator [Arthrobacter sp. GN70]TDG01053.1 LysR family transcriptional regulator [Arthrobacter terricola]